MMTHGFRKHVLTLAVTAVLSAGAAHAVPGERLEREEKSTVPAAQNTTITVKNARGRTVVVGRPDVKQVSIVAVKTAVGRDRDEAESLLSRLKVQVSERDGQVVVETRDDDSHEKSWSVFSFVKGERRSAWVDYTIEVPQSFGVSASTTSGEVRVSNLNGRADVAATSGDISIRAIGGNASVAMTSGDLEVNDVTGDLSVSATSGDVVIDNVRGKLDIDGTSGDFRASRVGRDADVELASGDFTLEGCSGNVSFRAASGDARITEVSGSIDASSSSGDIEVLIVPVGDRTFNLSSSSGDIDVFYVPVRDFGFALDVRTSSGSIEGDMPIKVTRVDRRRLQGVVGAGTAKVDVETASGDVMIMEQAQAASGSKR